MPVSVIRSRPPLCRLPRGAPRPAATGPAPGPGPVPVLSRAVRSPITARQFLRPGNTVLVALENTHCLIFLPLVSLAWSPVAGCRDPELAARRAEAFTGGHL